MIIICEKCSTKFNVPDSAIGANGRQVKCSSCAHTWLVKPEEKTIALPLNTSDPETLETTPAPEVKVESITIPVKAHQEPTIEAESAPRIEIKASGKRFTMPSLPIYQRPIFYIGSILAACLAFISFISLSVLFHKEFLVTKIPTLQQGFNLIGMYDTSGLKLELIDCKISEIQSSKSDDNSIEVEVSVSILNTSEVDKKLGDVRFSVYDIERNYVGELIMKLDQTIPAQQNTKIEGRLNRVPKDSYYVAVDIGNKVEFKINNPDLMHKIG